MSLDYTIREIKSSELPILKDLLYKAVFVPEGAEPPARDVLELPEIAVYIKDFGASDDLCLVAESGGRIIGAVWTRVLAGEVKGYGNIDSETPEFAISLFPEYRNQGIGTALMQHMISLLKARGYAQTSLSVNRENYAAKMYQSLGFNIINENEEDYIMLLEL